MSKKWRKRWWRDFKRELHEIAPMGGLAGIGAGGIALIGSLILSGGAVVAVVGGSLGIAAYKSFPKPFTDPKSLVGQTFSPPSVIPLLSEEVSFVGIFGETQSGKSTLLRKLQLDTEVPKPTRGLHATALRTNGVNPRVFFLLDGEGESPAQQSKICTGADILFFVVDHNLSDKETKISRKRKDDHVKFWNDLATFFEDRSSDVSKIHVLLNKNDCWQNSAGSTAFAKWGDELVELIGSKVRCGEITVTAHSNFETDNVSVVWNMIEEGLS